MAKPLYKHLLIRGEIEKAILPSKVDLIVTSPPYGIGKNYECFQSLEDHTKWIETIVPILRNHLNPNGAICWQVGPHLDKNGDYMPLDIIHVPIFRNNGFSLKNRIIWKFGSGLHYNSRLSGRYEVMLWFVLNLDAYTFNLDPIRIASKYPGKTSYKGPKRGKLSGNPLGKNPSDVWTIIIKEWERAEWDFPNVKSSHIEKVKTHPCQFPIELAERCILAFSDEGDTILDPFVGTGSTGCAAAFHGRLFIGVDTNSAFIEIARQRILEAEGGTLKTRKIGTPIQTISNTAKRKQIPHEWKQIRDEQAKKRRLYKQYKKEDQE